MSVNDLLENNIGAQVHNVPPPAPHWVQVLPNGGASAAMWLDLNDAVDQLTFINCFKRGNQCLVSAVDLPAKPKHCPTCYRGKLSDRWSTGPVYINTNRHDLTKCPACASKEVAE